MSLDTVIKIGKFYRQDKYAWKYHDQINSVMKDVDALLKYKDKEGNPIATSFYEVQVRDTGGELIFDWDNKQQILDEDKKRSLYYLNFKTSKKDTSKRYLLGDIIYSCYHNKNNELVESGNYKMQMGRSGGEEKKSSFWLGEDIAGEMNNTFIQKFRTEFRNKAGQIESFFKGQASVVLHFNFEGKRWLDMEGVVDSIDHFLTLNLVQEHTDKKSVVLEKYLYKTLGGVTPDFKDSARYKNRLFTRDEIISLMYAGKAAESPLLRFGNIGVIALPHSDRLDSEMIINFFERKKKTVEKQLEEEEIEEENIQCTDDDFFAGLVDNTFDSAMKFDIIFTNIPSSPAGVFSDLIEISNVEKSLLVQIHEDIKLQKRIQQNRAEIEFPGAKIPFSFQIRSSFLKILGDVTKDKKKYLFHLLKVLPQIYTGTYYEDPLLLPVFLEKVEYNIRESKQGFGTLKYDFYFLMSIQKRNGIMNITQTKSYVLGKNLGIMARQFAAWKEDCPIKAFEKSYVGNLSRRIVSIDELVKFASFINEKLIMHERSKYNEVRQASEALTETIRCFGDEKYNKYNCSLGFFESYYEIKVANKNTENND